MYMTHIEAIEFFSIIFKGEHHIPGKIKPFGQGYVVKSSRNMATYDGDLLTRLVLLAHLRAVRVELIPTSGMQFKIAIHKRGRVGYMYERHPDIKEADSRFREEILPVPPQRGEK